MKVILNKKVKEVYDSCNLIISQVTVESEGKEYDACRFKLNELNIVSRRAKITPKKVGQFVTFWKRNENGITEPFDENDTIDFYAVTVESNDQLGQFVFPRAILTQKGIISTKKKDGKRGFRVYPKWDTPTSKQAQRTQVWQLDYFYVVDQTTDLSNIKKLFRIDG